MIEVNTPTVCVSFYIGTLCIVSCENLRPPPDVLFETVYEDGWHERSTKVKPEHLEHPLVGGSGKFVEHLIVFWMEVKLETQNKCY